MTDSEGKALREALAAEIEGVRMRLEAAIDGLDAPALPLFGRLGAVGALYQLYYDALLADTGLTFAEYQTLGVLRGGEGGRSPTDLADTVRQTTAGMTKTLDRLQRAELVERRPHPSDRRRVEVFLTAAGRSAAEALIRADSATQERVLAGSSERQRRDLSRALDVLIERLASVGLGERQPG